jgi:hypothetical protein
MSLSLLLLLLAYGPVQGFVSVLSRSWSAGRRSVKFFGAAEETEGAPLSGEVRYDGIAVSGFVDRGKNFADPFVFSKLFHTAKWTSITTVTDDVAFARKRLVNPNTVYSGLIDVIKYATVTGPADWEKALDGSEAWLAYAITPDELAAYAAAAVKSKLKRVVFAVKVAPDSRNAGEGVQFDDVCTALSTGGVAFTIFKYSETRKMGEAKFPFRIVRGALALPTEGEILSSDDLMRVLVESVDIPKTFNAVYGIGPGTAVDTEILVYMKSQGWPERVQVGLLVGDMMEKLEEKFKEEAKNREEKSTQDNEAKAKAAASGNSLTMGPDGNKFAGFFK